MTGLVPLRLATAFVAASLAACSPAGPAPVAAPPTPVASVAATAPTTAAPPTAEPSHPSRARPAGRPRPDWLGTRVLPRRADGFGQVLPTPRVLRNRRLVSEDLLPPPVDGRFAASVRRVPKAVAARSTWSEGCPVALSDLRYVTLTFHGFDDRAHTGELLVHASVAEDIVSVFRRLYRERFPIEEMRVVAPPELDAPPTGDGNNTTSFVCRPSRGSSSWSEHAYGLAIDVNPFHNPYVRGDLVLPELASAYTRRDRVRPGMVVEGGVVTEAFDAIGWGWGGRWSSSLDWMHFSRSGR